MIKMLLPFVVLLVLSCDQNDSTQPLPILGNKIIENGDTTYHTIRNFEFINQDSQIVTNKSFDDIVYIADFFFTSCPTICPKVKKQMLRIQAEFADESRLKMISHSVDTKRDTVGRLKRFAEKLDVNTDQWMFVTGIKDSIYSIAEDYFSIAKEDPDAPGGFDHSGKLILVDQKKRVRSFCDGTNPQAVDKFMSDIRKMLAE